MNLLNVGVIGGGIMGSQHMLIVEQYHRSSLTALSTADHGPGRELSVKFGVKYYEDYMELLEDTDIQAVIIATPDFTHGEIVTNALQAGKHVLVEKPLATNLEESKQIIHTARSNGLKVMTLYNHRWIPAYTQAKQLLETNGSNPVMGYARKNDRIFVPTEMIRWSDRTTCAYFLSSHDIDLMNWFMDSKVTEVYGNAVSKVLKARGINTPDAIQIQAKYANGSIATFESCWVYPNSFPTMTDSLLEIVTENEVIHLPRVSECVEYAGPESYNYPRNQLNLNVLGKQRGSTPSAIQHYIDCVLDDQEPYVTLESSHHISAILDAAHRSIETGVPVKVTE